MSTIEYYLRQLDFYRKLLIKNLRDFGVECSDDETYNSLIPKIYSLSSSGEVVVDNLQLRYYEGSEEDVQYIFEHTVEAVQQTNLRGKFYKALNLKHLPLYRLNYAPGTLLTYLFQPNTPYGDLNGVRDIPLVSIDATGCDLTYGNSTNAKTYNYSYETSSTNSNDRYNNLETVNLTNATVSWYMLMMYTCTYASPKVNNLILSNTHFISEYISNIFGYYYYSRLNNTIKSIDLTGMIYDKPIKGFYKSFCNMPEVESINLGDIVFADTVEFDAIEESKYNYITEQGQHYGFKNLDKLKTFPLPLDKLEGKTANAIHAYKLTACEGALIFPNMTLTSRIPFFLYYFYKLNKIDISKVSLDYDGPLYFGNAFNCMGLSLSEDARADAEFVGYEQLLSNYVIGDLRQAFYCNYLMPKGKFTLPPMTVDTTLTQTIFSSAFGNIPSEEIYITNPITLTDTSTRVFSLSYIISYSLWLKKLVVDLGRTKCNSINGLVGNCPVLEELYLSIDSCDIDDNDNFIDFTSIISSTQAVKLSKITCKDMRLKGGLYNPGASGSSTTRYPGLTTLIFDNCTFNGFTSLCRSFKSLKSTKLEIIGMDMERIIDITDMFYWASKLEEFTIPAGLGKGFTQKTANYAAYTLNLSPTKLNAESIVGVINGLYDLNLTYDVANGGTLYTQKLYLGNTLKAKLTPEEIAIATNKGWTVS